MIIEIFQFLLLWFVEVIIFATVGILVFNDNSVLLDLMKSVLYYFTIALGNPSLDAYCRQDLLVDDYTQSLLTINPTKCTIGQYYNFVFMIVNDVIMLNLVIAILSSIYSFYEDKRQGLYYVVLIDEFVVREFDDKYGAVVCALPPLNLLIMPF